MTKLYSNHNIKPINIKILLMAVTGLSNYINTITGYIQIPD